MAALDPQVKSLIQKSYPTATDVEEDPIKLSATIFPTAEYTTPEKESLGQHLLTAAHIASPSEDSAKTAERLSTLNTHLSARTTLLGSKPSIADIALYQRLAPVVQKWNPDERTGEQGHHHIVRWLDFVQNAPLFGLKVDEGEKVKVDVEQVVSPIKPVDAKAEKERKKREKAVAEAGASAAVAAGATVTSAASEEAVQSNKASKKEKSKEASDKPPTTNGTEAPPDGAKTKKKEKPPKQPKTPAPAADKPLSPALIDLRVGHILKAEQHPNADSLYVSTIACGDAAGADNTSEYEGHVVRTVCSGLNGLVPLEEMQGRYVVVVCNLKPVTMRGIKSAAMVLAASPRLAPGEVDNHAGPVELVTPPAGAEAGTRVYFEGFEGEPEGVLNPKKKVWEECQVGFTTTGERAVGFDAGQVEKLKESAGGKGVAVLRTKEGGICTVKSLTGATVR